MKDSWEERWIDRPMSNLQIALAVAVILVTFYVGAYFWFGKVARKGFNQLLSERGFSETVQGVYYSPLVPIEDHAEVNILAGNDHEGVAVKGSVYGNFMLSDTLAFYLTPMSAIKLKAFSLTQDQ